MSEERLRVFAEQRYDLDLAEQVEYEACARWALAEIDRLEAELAKGEAYTRRLQWCGKYSAGISSFGGRWTVAYFRDGTTWVARGPTLEDAIDAGIAATEYSPAPPPTGPDAQAQPS